VIPGQEKIKIALVGSSGYVGSVLLQQLINQRVELGVLYNRRMPEKADGCHLLCCDLMDKSKTIEILRGYDVVIHLAWQDVDTNKKSDPKQISNNLEITKNILAACEHNKIKRFVSLSYLGVARECKSTRLSEKYLVEKEILNSQVEEKIIIRSPIIFGGDKHSDRLMSVLEKMMRIPLVYPLPRQKRLLNLVHVHDITRIIIKHLTGQVAYKNMIVPIKGNLYCLGEILKRYMFYTKQTNKIGVGGLLSPPLQYVCEKYIKKQDSSMGLEDIFAISSMQTDADNKLWWLEASDSLAIKGYRDFLKQKI
jgi:dTDP-4-dehydrorhamnose reductase